MKLDMKRHLKDGTIRHYCDVCHKPIYDEELRDSGVVVFGAMIKETKIVKRHRPFFCNSFRKDGIRYNETCSDCRDKLLKKQ